MAVRFRTWQIYTTASIVLMFAGVTVLASFAGVQTSLEHWQIDHGIEFDVFLAERLSRLMPPSNPADPAQIADNLTPYLDPTLYAMVFDDEDSLIYWTWKGDHWYQRPASNGGMDSESAEVLLTALISGDAPFGADGGGSQVGISLADSFRAGGQLQDILSGGVRTGGFVAGSNGFTVNRTNRRLLEELARGAFLGLASAIVLTAVIAGSFSRRVGRSISLITKSMSRIAEGDRKVALPVCRIAELNEIAQSAGALQSRLAREEHLRRQWTMDIAHDLRTPIANIRAQAEAMSDGLLEPTALRLESLAMNVQQLSGLTDNLMLLARMESPQYVPELAEIRIRDLALGLEQEFDARLRESERTLTIDTTDGVIHADGQLMKRALTNLIENAFRHGYGPIRCSFTTAALSVQSRGLIAADSIRFVFDRLYRGAPDRSGDGHGLGLAIVKAVCDVHGWQVEAASADNEVTFTVLLKQAGLPGAAVDRKKLFDG